MASLGSHITAYEYTIEAEQTCVIHDVINVYTLVVKLNKKPYGKQEMPFVIYSVFSYFKHHVYYVSINNFIYYVSVNNFLKQHIYNNMLFMSLILDIFWHVIEYLEVS